jgi:hypothetical protein
MSIKDTVSTGEPQKAVESIRNSKSGIDQATEILEQAQSELSAAKCVEMHKMVSDASKGYGDPDILDSLISPEEAMERWKDADK